MAKSISRAEKLREDFNTWWKENYYGPERDFLPPEENLALYIANHSRRNSKAPDSNQHLAAEKRYFENYFRDPTTGAISIPVPEKREDYATFYHDAQYKLALHYYNAPSMEAALPNDKERAVAVWNTVINFRDVANEWQSYKDFESHLNLQEEGEEVRSPRQFKGVVARLAAKRFHYWCEIQPFTEDKTTTALFQKWWSEDRKEGEYGVVNAADIIGESYDHFKNTADHVRSNETTRIKLIIPNQSIFKGMVRKLHPKLDADEETHAERIQNEGYPDDLPQPTTQELADQYIRWRRNTENDSIANEPEGFHELHEEMLHDSDEESPKPKRTERLSETRLFLRWLEGEGAIAIGTYGACLEVVKKLNANPDKMYDTNIEPPIWPQFDEIAKRGRKPEISRG